MDFSRIARQLNEGESLDAAASASEKAVNGAQTAKDANMKSREKQKSQMAQQRSTVTKSDVSYASEEARISREIERNLMNGKCDWRQELKEAMGVDDQPNHPYVDVMPAVDQKQREAKKQMKAAVKGSEDDSHNAGEGGGPGDVQKESASNPFQMHFDKDGKPYTSKGTKEERDRIAKNIAGNRKREPDPYKARAGESD